MTGKGEQHKNAILDHVLGGPNYERPSHVFLALYNEKGEVKGGGYKRAAIPNIRNNFPPAKGGSKTVAGAVNFPVATNDWGKITHAALHSHPTEDQPLYHASITPPRTVPEGAVADFPSGTITASES